MREEQELLRQRDRVPSDDPQRSPDPNGTSRSSGSHHSTGSRGSRQGAQCSSGTDGDTDGGLVTRAHRRKRGKKQGEGCLTQPAELEIDTHGSMREGRQVDAEARTKGMGDAAPRAKGAGDAEGDGTLSNGMVAKWDGRGTPPPGDLDGRHANRVTTARSIAAKACKQTRQA